jgi:hypothetical protein
MIGMDPRPVEDWTKIFERLPSPDGEPVEHVIARRIIGDLVAYGHASRNRERDTAELANALTAYAKLLHQSGVTP